MELTREDLQRIIKEELAAVLEGSASKSYCESTPCDEMGFTQKASCKSQGHKDCYKKNEEKNPRIPRKKGQPAKSKKHSDLYTDEDPKGTIHGLKFATEEDAKKSVAKIKKSGRSHAHKVQAAVAMEQRAKAAGKKSAAAVYRKYINSVKKEEVYSEKQRRYMCAMAKPDAKRPEGLSQEEAKEMCEGPMLDEKKKKKKKKSKKRKLTYKPGSESSLRDWFGRKGAKGKKKGWVDCNAPDGKGGYKSCGRSDGEKRKKYPACRPTPGACKKMKGSKGKSWGKKAKKGKKG